MDQRPLGRIDHRSSVAVLGCAAFAAVSQEEADGAVTRALEAGVNHVDVAPSYGEAERRLARWVPELVRRGVLIAGKTLERSASGARAELEGSLHWLGLDRFRLYQLHAVGSVAELDRAMDALGSLEDARAEGLIEHIGITGHGHEAPAALREALRRFEFATVMFPVNPVLWSNASYRADGEDVLSTAGDRGVGVLAIKAAAKQPWHGERRYSTWYQPYDEPAEIAAGIRFALTRPLTAFCTPGDVRLLDAALDAAQSFHPLDAAEAAGLVADRADLASIFG